MKSERSTPSRAAAGSRLASAPVAAPSVLASVNIPAERVESSSSASRLRPSSVKRTPDRKHTGSMRGRASSKYPASVVEHVGARRGPPRGRRCSSTRRRSRPATRPAAPSGAPRAPAQQLPGGKPASGDSQQHHGEHRREGPGARRRERQQEAEPDHFERQQDAAGKEGRRERPRRRRSQGGSPRAMRRGLQRAEPRCEQGRRAGREEVQGPATNAVPRIPRASISSRSLARVPKKAPSVFQP